MSISPTTSVTQYDRVQLSLEDEFGRPLTTREQVKNAYGASTGMTGDALEEEFRIAIGEQGPGSPVEEPDGSLVDDPEIV